MGLNQVSFFNSQTRSQDLICGFGGTIGYSYQSDNTDDDDIYDNLGDGTVDAVTVTFADAAGNTWAFTMYVRYEDFERPTDADCAIIISQEGRLLYDDTGDHTPLTVAYAVAP